MKFPGILKRRLIPATRLRFTGHMQTIIRNMGDLNNTEAMREHVKPAHDSTYEFKSFAIRPCDEDQDIRKRYRPFLLSDEISESDWVSKLELATAAKMVDTELLVQNKDRLKILVLYGSLRARSVAFFIRVYRWIRIS